MIVYKFGGASVKSAEAFRNLLLIIEKYGSRNQLVLVVSAMGKTTNALENIYDLAVKNQDYQPALQECEKYHAGVAEELFPLPDHPVYERLRNLFSLLQQQLSGAGATAEYDQNYDQVISYGELLSSAILHHLLTDYGYANTWLDSRKYIRTDATWREARIDWESTERVMRQDLPQLLQNELLVTQGFLGGANTGYTTTLGREGSDFSAAIFAYCLGASALYIWKDVDGLLNADPKHFANTVRYPEISYQETIEMAYYGATVIHPKTIKPLANKGIPLYIKSFLNPMGEGTKICDCRFEKIAPAFIIKEKQCLISFSPKDFAFISEKNLSTIFHALSEMRLKINLMQNSAISFSVCTDWHEERLQHLRQTLHDQFNIQYNTDLTLYTIKNYDKPSLAAMLEGKNVLLEQRTRTTFQFAAK